MPRSKSLAALSRRCSSCSKSRSTPFGLPMTKNYHEEPALSLYYAIFSKSGPFWPLEQTHSEGDIFECLNEDGAGTAIAEAACRHSPATPCDLVSFAPSKFNQTPLSVVWARSAGGEVDVRLGNYWELASLSSYLAELSPITDWDGLHRW